MFGIIIGPVYLPQSSRPQTRSSIVKPAHRDVDILDHAGSCQDVHPVRGFGCFVVVAVETSCSVLFLLLTGLLTG
jgi:hypothetical protein